MNNPIKRVIIAVTNVLYRGQPMYQSSLNQPSNGTSSRMDLVVNDIEISDDSALFRLENGNDVELRLFDLLRGLHVRVEDSDLVLYYQLPMDGAQGIASLPAMLNAHASLENRVMLLATTTMTGKLVGPLRQTLTKVAGPKPGMYHPEPNQQPLTNQGVAHRFATPLLLSGCVQGTYGHELMILGYELRSQAQVSILLITPRKSEIKTKSVTEWRKEMTAWIVNGPTTPEQNLLLGVIKGHGTQAAPNSESKTSPTQTPMTIDVSGVYVTGTGVKHHLRKSPVHSYQLVEREGDETLVHFFNEEGTMIASAKVSQLVLSKYRQGLKGLAIEIMNWRAKPSRRATLIAHAEHYGVEALADALKQLKH